jgi:hypothetical protein
MKMLSDDITQGAVALAGRAKKTFSDTARGAMFLGAIGLVIGIGIMAGPAVGAWLTSAHLATTVMPFIHAAMSIAAVKIAVIGAAVGATVFGVGSLLPGVEAVKGLGRKIFRSSGITPFYQPDITRGPAPDLRGPVYDELPDNPMYQPNLGADILARGNTAQGIDSRTR